MGRKRRLKYVEPGESSSHVGLNEVPSRQQAPPANDDRRQSQGSDDETQAPDIEDVHVPAAEAVVMPNKSGPNRFDDMWNMPPGKKLFLEINKAGQLVGENARPWEKWLRTVARKPDMCPINYRSWHSMPQQYKNRYRIPLANQRKWVLSRIGKLWRGHKSKLKEKHCKLDTTKEDLLQLSLPKVDDTQFHALVEYWFIDNFKAKEKGRQLERGEMYEVAYSHRDGTAVNATIEVNIYATSNIYCNRPKGYRVVYSSRSNEEKCARYDAEMRLMRRMLTSLCPSFPSMSMDDFGDGDSAVDIQTPDAQHLSFDDTH
ncbi:hypothetical protein SO802_006058 [Lithocarpus litseifolius]|uniref:Uncharacterized protein n=1 Tax=Lithocarpus litseifolius TaxID=425828 RepID=A0AAW2DJV3_9ROSI